MELNQRTKLSDIGLIPADWETQPLGELCVKIQDGNYGESYPKANEFLGYGIPFITSKAIGKDGILRDNLIDFISNEKHEQLQKAQLKLNDVLFTNRGASVGAIGFVDLRIANGNIGPQLTLLRADESMISSKFLFHAMKSHIVQKQIQSQDSGSAMNFFGISSTKKFLLPIPIRKEEQEVISNALSEADAYIESLEKLICKKRLIKKGLMQELLTGKRRLEGFTGNWTVQAIGSICHIDSESLSTVTDENYEFKYISLEDVNNGCLTGWNNIIYKNAPSRARRIVRSGDILIGTVRPNLRSHCLIEHSIPNLICSTGFAVLRAKGNVDSRFLFECFFEEFVERQIEVLVSGSNYPAISSSDVRRLKVRAPSAKEEQIAIAKTLDDFQNEITRLSSKILKARLLKQGMMQELLTGRIRLV